MGFGPELTYDAAAVERYIAALHGRLTELETQLDSALALAHEAQDRVEATHIAEALLGRALLRAQRVSEETLARAEQQAQAIVADAERWAAVARGEVSLESSTGTAAGRPDANHLDANHLDPSHLDEWAPPHQTATDEPDPPGSSHSTWAPPITAGQEPDAPGRHAEGGPLIGFPRSGRDVDAVGWAGPGPVPLVGPLPAEPIPQPEPPISEHWLQFGATGTDGRPVLAPMTIVEPAPEATEADAASCGADASERSVGGSLRERWRLALSGPASLDDDFFSRATDFGASWDDLYTGDARPNHDHVGSPGTSTQVLATMPEPAAAGENPAAGIKLSPRHFSGRRSWLWPWSRARRDRVA